MRRVVCSERIPELVVVVLLGGGKGWVLLMETMMW